jgi:hypothetical protein
MPAKRKARKAPTLKLQRQIVPKMTLNMPLDEKRAKAIRKCIERGQLRITISKVDLATGRIGDGWLYD